MGWIIRVTPRKPDPDETGGPDTQPCPICGKVGHYFYDKLDCIDKILGEGNDVQD